MQRYWIWLSLIRELKDAEKAMLLERFCNPEDIYYASRLELQAIEGLSQEALAAIAKKDLREAEKILDRCRELGIHTVTMDMSAYPKKLKHIADPPLVLYCIGRLPDFESMPYIGAVGTRKASSYGLKMAKRMGWQLTRCGAAVVSGMAGGIDAAATEGALEAGGNPVGVLGCGVDVVYPKSNRWLFEQMRGNGCLISEYPPGTPAYRWNFPQRNRIISGISNGVLVVEAPTHSGALITARQAIEQGRDVFVVPGNVDVASCEGSNDLLREGASMAASGWDVVREYQYLFPDKVKQDMSADSGKKAPVLQEMPASPPTPDKKDIDIRPQTPYIDRDSNRLSAQEQAVLSAIEHDCSFLDDIIAETGLPSGQVLALLTALRIRGLVKALPGGRVAVK